MTLRIATPDDIPSVEKLRITAYETATGSKTPDTSFLRWNAQDEQSVVLVLEDKTGRIISTMRGHVINTIPALEDFFDISLPASFPIPVPVFTMGRAATFFEYRRLGYSAAMRILFLKACLLSTKIQCVASTIQADASRVALLKQIGYRIEKADISHRINSYFHNTSETLFNLLPKQHFASAIALATEKIATPLSTFEIPDGLVPAIERSIDHFCSPRYASVVLE